MCFPSSIRRRNPAPGMAWEASRFARNMRRSLDGLAMAAALGLVSCERQEATWSPRDGDRIDAVEIRYTGESDIDPVRLMGFLHLRARSAYTADGGPDSGNHGERSSRPEVPGRGPRSQRDARPAPIRPFDRIACDLRGWQDRELLAERRYEARRFPPETRRSLKAASRTGSMTGRRQPPRPIGQTAALEKPCGTEEPKQPSSREVSR